MNNGQSNGRRYAFPVITAVVLLGIFAVLLWVMLVEADLVHKSQGAFPQPTIIPPTEVAAATAEATVIVEVTEAATGESTAVAEGTEAAVGDMTAEATGEATAAADGAEVAVAPTEGVLFDPARVAAGKAAFDTVCIACHGMNAQGVPGLGKDLVHSDFVHGLTDEELAHFITVGRPAFDPANTTGIEMPARGGNPTISDEQIALMVVYLRSLAAAEGVGPVHANVIQAVEATAAPTEAAAQQPAPTTVAAAPVTPTEWVAPVAGGTPVAAQPIANDPQGLYLWNCSTCHGVDGQGYEPYGPGILGSTLLDPANEEDLIAFLIGGDNYDGTQGGFVHPPRGGYPALSDEQIEQLASYVQGLAGS